MRIALCSAIVLSVFCVEWAIAAKQNPTNNNRKKVAWDPKSKLKTKPETVLIDEDERVPEGSGTGRPTAVPSDIDVESSGLGPDDEDALAKSWGSGNGEDGEDGDVEETDKDEGQTEPPEVATVQPAPPAYIPPQTTEEPVTEEEEEEPTQEWTPALPVSTPVPDTTTRDRFVPTYRPIETSPPWMAFTESPATQPPPLWTTTELTSIYESTSRKSHTDPFFGKPGILAAVIGGAIVGLLAAILIVMFIVYRMRKKDEGSYALEEPKSPQSYPYAYHKAPAKEFYA